MGNRLSKFSAPEHNTYQVSPKMIYCPKRNTINFEQRTELINVSGSSLGQLNRSPLTFYDANPQTTALKSSLKMHPVDDLNKLNSRLNQTP